MSTLPKILYIHCGYPKTATTTLQKWVFPKIKYINYVGRKYAYPVRERDEECAMRGMRCDGKASVESANNLVEYLKNIDSSDGPVFISNESVMAQCMVPWKNQGMGFNPMYVADSSRAFRHLKEVALRAGFDELKLVVTLRRQDQLLTSYFAEAYKERYGRVSKLNTFSKLVNHILEDGSLVSPSCIDYCAMDDMLNDMFGKNSYKFLLYEWLDGDAQYFAEHLGEFLKVDAEEIACLLKDAKRENQRRNVEHKIELTIRRKSLTHFIDRLKAKFLPNRNLGIGRILGILLSRIEYGPRKFSPNLADMEKIRSYYSKSNAQLVQRYPELKALIQ